MKKFVKQLYNGTKYSIAGFKTAIQNEYAFRLEILITLLAIPVGWYIAVSLSSFIILMASLLMVMVVEMLNSAIEAVVDRVSFERHDLSKKAKDYGSAAVMLAIIIALMLWVCEFYSGFIKMY